MDHLVPAASTCPPDPQPAKQVGRSPADQDDFPGVVVLDSALPDFPVVASTSAAARLLGRAGEDLVGKGLANLLEATADPEAVRETCRRLAARESGVVALLGSSGTRRLSLYLEPGGDRLAVCQLGEEDQDRLAMQHASCGLLLLDPGCRVVTLNATAAALEGQTPEELVGGLWPRLAPDGPNAAVVPQILHELRALRPWRGELAGPRSRGGAETVDAAITPVRAPDGTLSRFAVVAEDAGERRRRESDHLRVCQLETLTLIAGGTAHDLNNIFTTLVAETDALAHAAAQAGAPPDPGIQRLVEGVRRAQQIVLQLLAMTRAHKPRRTRLPTKTFIEQAVEFALRGSNVRGDILLPDSLGHIDADEGQIGQIVDNLVINARQAMPSGGCLKVRGRRRALVEGQIPPLPRGEYAELVFSDDGPGIRPDLLGRIFEPYFTTKPGGNGLGLATARRIAEQHGGWLSADSPPGCGAVFTLLLPLAQRPEAPASAIAQPPPRVPEGLHVLLVDDDRLVARAVTRMLAARGIQVTHAADGVEGARLCAHRLASGNPFAVALVDATIPGGAGGAEALALLREAQPGLPAVLVSGYPGAESSGFDASLHKPFSSDELLRTVAAILEPAAGC